MSSSPTRTQSGFTILEVVLAMGLLVMAMTSLLGLFTFGAALTRTAALRTAAATAIEAVVADLEESLFALEEDGSVGDPRVIVDRPVPGATGVIYSALARVNPDDPDAPSAMMTCHVNFRYIFPVRPVRPLRENPTSSTNSTSPVQNRGF